MQTCEGLGEPPLVYRELCRFSLSLSLSLSSSPALSHSLYLFPSLSFSIEPSSFSNVLLPSLCTCPSLVYLPSTLAFGRKQTLSMGLHLVKIRSPPNSPPQISFPSPPSPRSDPAVVFLRLKRNGKEIQVWGMMSQGIPIVLVLSCSPPPFHENIDGCLQSNSTPPSPMSPCKGKEL